MRIAIDARLNAYRRGGIPQYTQQLMAALAPLMPHDELLALQHYEQLRPLVVAANLRRRSMYTPPHHRLEQLTLPLELLPLRLNLLHSPDFIPPLRRPCPAVITIHDLAFMHYPQILDEAASRYYGQVRQAVHSAEGVIAVSEATRDDIVTLLELDPARITVIAEAAAPSFRRQPVAPDEERLINGQHLRADSFLLFVSTLEPRKNLPTLLRALRICLDRRPAGGYHLVVVGARGWRYESIFESLNELRLAEHVSFLDSVTSEDLLWLYNACRLYANPSLYEGFGLPLLEAMACGAACLAANTSSLPEIAGEAAILLPPDEPAAWAEAIALLWDDAPSRAELASRARERAGQFSWQRAARETLALYRLVAEAGKSSPAPVYRSGSAPAPDSTLPLPLVTSDAAPNASPTLPEAPATLHVREVAAPLMPRPQVQEVPLLDHGVAEHSNPPAAQPWPQAADAPRPCLRCGTPLVPAELQHALTLLPTNGSVQVPRLWICPNCGSSELVIERQNAERRAQSAEHSQNAERRTQSAEHSQNAERRTQSAERLSTLPYAELAVAAPEAVLDGREGAAPPAELPLPADEEAAPTALSLPSTEAPPLKETAPLEEAAPTAELPLPADEEAAPTALSLPSTEAPPLEETAPLEEEAAPPAELPLPADEEAAPTALSLPSTEAPPLEEAAPLAELPATPDQQAPALPAEEAVPAGQLPIPSEQEAAPLEPAPQVDAATLPPQTPAAKQPAAKSSRRRSRKK